MSHPKASHPKGTADHAATTHHHMKLKQMMATAICSNDIMSSCLYVSGVAILLGGSFGPLVLLLIGLVLFFYKMVYTEVVEALPINGGAYNCLLNATSKTIAAIAGVMTTLSYVATAVLSGNVGVEYLMTILPESVHAWMDKVEAMIHMPPTLFVTIALLLFFAMLVIGGLKDSAKVAFGIFAAHITTLVLFLILGAIYLMNGGASHFMENWEVTKHLISDPAGTVVFSSETVKAIARGGLLITLFLGFSASLLGVSGFESSANFVEEQERGVFRKTLRNMLAGVALFNPLIALVILMAMPYASIISAKDFLLSEAAMTIGGTWFKYVVVIDAFLVLWGAVLTSFVGVSGLLYRMSADGCIPGFLAKVNSKGSYPRIVVLFFLLCSSILLLTRGNLLSLAGVYTIAFLGVMSLFALGNLVLKEARTDLKRTYRAPIIFVCLAFLSTALGLVGNIIIDPMNLGFFAMYFVPSMAIVLCVIYQDRIMKFLLRVTRGLPRIQRYIHKHFSDMTGGKFVVFIHHANRLHAALDYIDRNETGWNIHLVCCRNEDAHGKDQDYDEIRECLPILKKIGLYPHFNIDLLYKDMEFGPEVIDEVSEELGVRKNRIMIGSIHDFHKFDYDELGGVRIIFG